MNLNKQALDNILNQLKIASEQIKLELARFSDENGKLRKEQLESMQARVSASIDQFMEQYNYVIGNGTNGVAEIILNRNGDISANVEGTKKTIGILKDNVIFAIANYQHEDGLTLSDRIWKVGHEAKTDISNKLANGILNGYSHVKIANSISQYLEDPGGMRYKAERLVLTEMAKAYNIANEMAIEQMNLDSEYSYFTKWELSPAHKVPDVCDILATQNVDGEGKGVYKVSPSRPHPGCMCYVYPVYKKKGTTQSYKDISNVKPSEETLPKSQWKLAENAVGKPLTVAQANAEDFTKLYTRETAVGNIVWGSTLGMIPQYKSLGIDFSGAKDIPAKMTAHFADDVGMKLDASFPGNKYFDKFHAEFSAKQYKSLEKMQEDILTFAGTLKIDPNKKH